MPVKMILDQGRGPMRIYTDEVESAALQQLGNIVRFDLVHHHVAAMPDVQLGIGATVGAVIPTKGAIIPLVGVDIGCGPAPLGWLRTPLPDGR
ncbi:RtcB family protein [endosymbiont of Ridgeia piscesae]|jgi:tRNA-splicing ligase RtcB|uniref:3'-phosphate/5'-hydroxy nucleic acid ligase n=1 Tax=endosymbiont of Ridgeia piscesae TaxID=54398 RepID=A0A0T5YT29_9GAMM|nr:RtcB family protein [endosymbiont of Ridgeia piscesae]KRT53633.1 tRNA-splicing ligase RtcB [endosymbiont of Ridgeia piscesae]KRT60077.1 tRNA-splicing ligase RtcB [endosymbiont of Ridgeia piscesae]